MPQDGLRSVIYRSFVTCDDPKGVVTCKTIRKSKTDHSQKKNMDRDQDRREIIVRRQQQQQQKAMTMLESLASANLGYDHQDQAIKMSKEEDEIPTTPASFQLLEVSRGARKLNHMIESWSKGVKFDGQSKDIAKDLLKGALDLQDSLVMLGKLQEASQYMAHLKKKQITANCERGRCDCHLDHDHYRGDEAWIGRRARSVNELRDKYPVTGFQKPRSSFDGSSSRTSTEELKKVIRESLVGQSLFSKARKCENVCFAQRSLDSPSTSDQSPSTRSSSQSSLARPATESPSASSSSAAAPRTAKGPNLIAKLMGIEEYQLKPLQATPQRRLEGHNSKNPRERRPVFDIDMPKARKPQYAVQKAVTESKSLQEILDTMQSKGLLRSNAARAIQPIPKCHNASGFKHRLVDDGPPIVLIKPLRVPSIETEETPMHTPSAEEEDPLYRRKMLRKLRRKEELHPKAVISYKEVNLKSDRIRRKSQEQNKIGEVPKEKEVIVDKESASVKLKAALPVKGKQQRIQATEKRADKIQKVTSVNRKPLEKNVMKTRSVPKSEDQAKKLSIEAGRQDSQSNVAKSQNSRQLSTKPSAIKHGEQTTACNSFSQKKNRIKKDKLGKKPTTAKSVTENSGGGVEEEKKIEVTIGSQFHESMIKINPENHVVDDQVSKEDADIYDSNVAERYADGQSSLSDATPSTPCINRELRSETTEEAPKDIDVCISTVTDEKALKSEVSLKALLLSSLSFQTHVEEHFNLNMNGSSILQTTYIDNFRESGMRLSLDCAKELVELKSLQDSQTPTSFRPLLPACAGKWRPCISLEMLVEEVCRGIEGLRKYSKFGGESLGVDGLYAMLETDLNSNIGFVNGIWDYGWRTGFSSDVAEQVVNDVERLVLSGLIEEVFT